MEVGAVLTKEMDMFGEKKLRATRGPEVGNASSSGLERREGD